MDNRLIRFVIVTVLAGCDELADKNTEAAVLTTLSGTISLAPDVEPPVGKLQVSVLWFDPALESDDTQSACDGKRTGWQIETHLLQQPVRVDTNFPSGFSVQLTEPPPAAALYPHPGLYGVSVARGDLVVYDDRNGNGRLDPSTVDERSPDLVLGSGKGTAPWGIGQRVHYSILYMTPDRPRARLEKIISPDDDRDLGLGEGNGAPGFSLVITEPDGNGGRTVEVQRLGETEIDLILEPTHYVQQAACSVMCSLATENPIDNPVEFLAGDVGEPVPSDLGVGTSAWSREDGDATMVSLAKCTKKYLEQYTDYTLDLDVMIIEGCTQSGFGFSYAAGTEIGSDAPFEWPCRDVRELDKNGFTINR